MHWLERLNSALGQLALGQGTVEILLWAHQDPLPDNQPHRHTYFEVCQVGAHGAGTYFVQGQEYALTPGVVFFARPGVVHQIVNTAQPHMELFWVSFQWTPPAPGAAGEVDSLLRAFAEAPVLAVPDDAGRLRTLWQALRTLAEGEVRVGYGAQVAGLMTALLLTLAQTGAGASAAVAEPRGYAPPGELTARLAMRFIHDNLNRPLSLTEVAQQAHVSPRHLSRVFRTFAGVAPAAYVTRARLDRAQGLLQHSDLPIKEVAAQVGYPDVHHFTRVFTQQVGCAPGEFRRSAARVVRNIHKPGALL